MPSYCETKKNKKQTKKNQVRKYHQVKVLDCCAENWVTTLTPSQADNTDMKYQFSCS